MPTAADVAAALGQRSEAPETAKPEGEEAEPGTEGGDGDEPEQPESGAAKKPEADAGESDEPAAPEGEDAAGEPGDPETTEDPAEAPEGEEPEKPETPAEKPAAEKRIGELTARAKTAEEALAKTREQLAAVTASQSGQLAPGVLEQIDSLDALAQQRTSLVKLHQWALTHPQGGELPNPSGKGDPIVYDAEAVQKLLGDTFELVHETIPQREKYLVAREQSESAAVNFYPWLKDTRTGPGAQVQAAIEAMPALRLLGPHYRTVAADGFVGQLLRESGIKVDGKLIERLKREQTTRKAAGASPAATAPVIPRRPPPQAPARAGVMPSRLGNRGAEAQSASKRLSKGDGNVRDITASIAAKLG